MLNQKVLLIFSHFFTKLIIKQFLLDNNTIEKENTIEMTEATSNEPILQSEKKDMESTITMVEEQEKNILELIRKKGDPSVLCPLRIMKKRKKLFSMCPLH